MRFYRKKLVRNLLKTVLVLWTVAANGSALGQSSEDRAFSAAQGLVRGNVQTVCDQLAFALKLDPQSTSLHRAAGAALVLGGEPTLAEKEFRTVLRVRPSDPLSLYGLGLCSVFRGDMKGGRDRIEMAMVSGDRTVCLLAQRFLDHAEGLRTPATLLAVPDSMTASSQMMGAWAKWDRKEYAAAMALADSAMKLLDGDPFKEPSALLIDVRFRNPLRSGAERAQTGIELGRTDPTALKAVGGTVRLTPEVVPDAGSLVGYRIDNQVGIVTNQPPYSFQWDTTQVRNGPHKVEIVIHTSQGNVLSRSERTVLTWNAGQTSDVRSAETEAECVRLLWQALTLKPGRASLAYLSGICAKQLGKLEIAERRFELCKAVDPLFSDRLAKGEFLPSRKGGASVWRGRAEPVVALTFDDGPYAGVTEQLLKILIENRVTATFFVIGRHVTARPNLARLIGEAGMQLENHSYTHPNLNLISSESVAAELLRTREAIRDASGQVSKYFRPPGGNMDKRVGEIARKNGITPCMWTLDGDSLEYGSPDRLVKFVVEKAKPGSIILLHNGRATTVDALPKIIEGLRRRGFGFASVDEVLNVVPDSTTGVGNRPR